MSSPPAAGCDRVPSGKRLPTGRRLRAALLALLPWHVAMAATPVLVQSAPGRFEIAAVDPSLAHAIAGVADEGWHHLAAPLGLPDQFPSPVFVRVVTGEEAQRAAPFRVIVEPGGIVSVRWPRWSDARILRRALVQALLMRLAVARHGVHERLTAPLWLEHACLLWWETRAYPAELDAQRQLAAVGPPTPIETLLGWERGEPEPPAYTRSAFWLLGFLQSESGSEGEWPEMLLRLLNGDDPLIAITSSFPGRYHSALERELWWQTGYHYVRRVRALPAMEAGESRRQLEGLIRFVFAAPDGEGDVVVPLSEVIERAGEPVVAAELGRRAVELAKLTVQLHPFYRNAGLSLADALASGTGKLALRKRQQAVAAFEQDWRDALELEAATTAALDRLEQGLR